MVNTMSEHSYFQLIHFIGNKDKTREKLMFCFFSPKTAHLYTKQMLRVKWILEMLNFKQH